MEYIFSEKFVLLLEFISFILLSLNLFVPKEKLITLESDHKKYLEDKYKSLNFKILIVDLLKKTKELIIFLLLCVFVYNFFGINSSLLIIIGLLYICQSIFWNFLELISKGILFVFLKFGLFIKGNNFVVIGIFIVIITFIIKYIKI
jgi:hypothetical protein